MDTSHMKNHEQQNLQHDINDLEGGKKDIQINSNLSLEKNHREKYGKTGYGAFAP